MRCGVDRMGNSWAISFSSASASVSDIGAGAGAGAADAGDSLTGVRRFLPRADRVRRGEIPPPMGVLGVELRGIVDW